MSLVYGILLSGLEGEVVGDKEVATMEKEVCKKGQGGAREVREVGKGGRLGGQIQRGGAQTYGGCAR